MKSIINLEYNNAYKWYNNNGIYIIGSIYYKNKFLENAEFIKFIEKNKNNLKDILKDLTGFYSIVIINEKQITLVSDVMRTFPLFYSVSNNIIEINDNIDSFTSKYLNKTLCNELTELRYVTSFDTIYNNIYQIQSNEIVTIYNTGNINRERYYNFDIGNKFYNEKDILKKITTTFDLSIDRLIKYANGRTLIIPLSGGYDSRQIVLSLHKKKYKNVICYTYGRSMKDEVLISKKIAIELGYDWYFIKYKNKQMRKMYYNKKIYEKLVKYISRGFSTPHIQEWMSIEYLKKNNLIPADSIIVPGFTGDALSGSHINESFFSKEEYNREELLKEIINYNYITTPDLITCEEKISNVLNITKDKLSLVEALNYYNKFDFEERQVKFITNSIRIYDYYGYQWYLPFWDRDYINIWKNVDVKYKYNRNILISYFNEEYCELMKKIPIYKNKKNKKTNNKILKVINILKYYYKDNLNLYGYLKYIVYLKTYFSKKIVSYDFIFGRDYIKFIMGGNKK